MSATLDAPGIRLQVAELLALREGVFQVGRPHPESRRPGAVPAKAAGAGMDLREIRDFAEGDDARRIDPAATARTGTPHVRSFYEDRDDTLLLIADFRLPMLWGTGATLRSVRAARAAVRRGWQAAARGASVAAMSINAAGVAVIPIGSGLQQMSRISHMLARWHDQALDIGGEGPPLAQALLRAGRLAPPGAEVLIVTNAEGFAETEESALAKLARRRHVRVLVPLDPIDAVPPPQPMPIHAGALGKFARLRPVDHTSLAQRLRTLNVHFEAAGDDAG